MASAAATTDTGLSLSASYTYTDDLLTKIQTPSTAYSFTYGDFALRTNVKAGDRTLATYTYADITKLLTELDYGNGDEVCDKGTVLLPHLGFCRISRGGH